MWMLPSVPHVQHQQRVLTSLTEFQQLLIKFLLQLERLWRQHLALDKRRHRIQIQLKSM